MDEFLNLKDSDEAKDEEGAARVTVEAAARERATLQGRALRPELPIR